MNIAYRTSFERDLEDIHDRALLNKIRSAIDAVKAAKSVSEIPRLKKLQGHDAYWRIKVGISESALRSKKESSSLSGTWIEKTSIDLFLLDLNSLLSRFRLPPPLAFFPQ